MCIQNHLSKLFQYVLSQSSALYSISESSMNNDESMKLFTVVQMSHISQFRELISCCKLGWTSCKDPWLL